jgi:sphingolipid delta-4 desaturase
LPWWGVLLMAWGIGAFANHCLYVMIHEATHDRIWVHRWANMLTGILSDIPNLLPAFVSFRTYHLRHHTDMSNYEFDADVPNHWETRLVGNGALRKALWLFLFPVFQLTRPPRLKSLKFMTPWTIVNWVVVFGMDVVIYLVFGPWGLLYLFASFYFSIGGLHPLSARWIQEHFQVNPPQETYSYYGPVNQVNLNIGYHNEHHDFPSLPWNKLPALKRAAPEFYDGLSYHRSYIALLFRFIFDPELSLASRPERPQKAA